MKRRRIAVRSYTEVRKTLESSERTAAWRGEEGGVTEDCDLPDGKPKPEWWR
jgi:hypothetical protein